MSRPNRQKRRRQRERARTWFPNEHHFTQRLALVCPSCGAELGQATGDTVNARITPRTTATGSVKGLTLDELGNYVAWTCYRAGQDGHGPGTGRVPMPWVLRALDAIRFGATDPGPEADPHAPHATTTATSDGLRQLTATLLGNASPASQQLARKSRWGRRVHAGRVHWGKLGTPANGPGLTDAQVAAAIQADRREPSGTWEQLRDLLAEVHAAQLAGELLADGDHADAWNQLDPHGQAEVLELLRQVHQNSDGRRFTP